MYINLENWFKINPKLLPILLLLKHAPKKDVSDKLSYLMTDEDLDFLLENNYIKEIKGKKKDNDLQKLRLDKKGTKYLNNLNEVEVSQETITIFEWLKEKYLKADKIVGNGAQTKRLIQWFSDQTGIEKNNLVILANDFTESEEGQEYSFKLENIWWKPDNPYQTAPKLPQSRLYNYYIKHKERLDRKFE